MAIRPRGVPEWAGPVGGALLAVLLGAEPVAAAVQSIGRQWNVLLFIFGLMLLATAAERSGAFAWIAEIVLERAAGSSRRLFVLLFLAASVATLVLSNDATAIVFTPIVYGVVSKRGKDALPFLFGCSFAANTSSFGLPFSNPANILVLPQPHLTSYLWHLGVPQVAAIAINLALFLAIFAPRLRGRYEFARAAAPLPAAFPTLVAMGCVGAAYLLALMLEWPIGPVAVLGGIATLAIARVAPVEVARHVGWSTFVLLAGLFALFDGVARAGFVTSALHLLESVARYGNVADIATAALGAALSSNLLNNLPVAVASAYIVAAAPPTHLAYPLIVGIDLGPNLTTAGSLSTILWLAVLRRRGIRVSAREYFRLGAIVVPPMLAVSVLWLWFVR